MLNYQAAQPRDTASLRNWIENTACLARDETAYLGSDEDLFCIAMQSDSLLVRLELLLERLLIFWCECVGRVSISSLAILYLGGIVIARVIDDSLCNI
jgi:hypothetical protein